MNDGTCSKSECEGMSCVWCESENCDKSCPCVPASQGCSGYSKGEYCQFDEQCADGLHCSGRKGGFVYEQACCPEGDEWDPLLKSCGTPKTDYQKYAYITQPDNSSGSSESDFDSFYPEKNGCLVGSCSDGDLDCDGKEDDICFAEEEVCDGKDNDLDGTIDDGVCSENCGHCGSGLFNVCDREECLSLGNCGFTKSWIGGKCESKSSAQVCINEVCDNGIDDDCNGKPDDGCAYEEFYNEDSSIDIGLKKRGEFFCTFDGQCNPGLACKGSQAAQSQAMLAPVPTAKLAESAGIGGGCCLPWEEWNSKDRECYDTRLGANILGCENNEECLPGLHCSWDGWFRNGACCAEGAEYDTSAGRCIECGVLAKPGDSDYCSQKAEIGCSCGQEEGNCASDSECFSGLYCSSTKRWWDAGKWGAYDVCCLKGTLYNPQTGKCDLSAGSLCSGNTKEACFASGDSCCFEKGACSECTNLNRNDRFCSSDLSCCDSDSGCNLKTNLSCATGVCCYPWEDMNENTGRCSMECPDCDDDKDGYSNAFEARVYSNPSWSSDIPLKRLLIKPCGSMFELPTAKDYAFSISVGSPLMSFSVSDFTNPESIGPSKLGELAGMLSGAIGGLWDDLQLVPMLLNGVGKLLEMSLFAANDPESFAVRSGYSLNQTKKVVESIFSEFGSMIVSSFISGLDGISMQGEDINIFFKDECNAVVFAKAYTKGYIEGYVIEQVAMAFIGVSEVKALVQAGFGATKIGGAIVKGLEAIEKIVARVLTSVKGFTKGIVDNVVVAINELAIRTIKTWGDDAIEGFGRIIKHGGKAYARELMTEMGEAGLKRASAKIASLSAKHGDEAIELLIKSKIGRNAIMQNWAEGAQDVLIKVLKEAGEDKLDNIITGMTKTARQKVGIKLNKLASFSDEAAEAALKSPGAKKLLTELPDDAIEPFTVGMKFADDPQKYADDVAELADKKGITDSVKATQSSGFAGKKFEITGNAQLNRQGIGGGVDDLGVKVKRPDGSDFTDIDAVLKDGSIVEMKSAKPDNVIADEVAEWQAKMKTVPEYKNRKIKVLIDREPSPGLVDDLKKLGIDEEDIIYYNKNNDNILGFADEFENEEEEFIDFLLSNTKGASKISKANLANFREFVPSQAVYTSSQGGVLGFMTDTKTGTSYFVKAGPPFSTGSIAKLEDAQMLFRSEVTIYAMDIKYLEDTRSLVKPEAKFFQALKVQGEDRAALVMTKLEGGSLFETSEKLGISTGDVVKSSADDLIKEGLMTKNQVETVKEYMLFDIWRGNTDRNIGNIFLTKDGKVAMIDPAFSFNSNKFTSQIDMKKILTFDDVAANAAIGDIYKNPVLEGWDSFVSKNPVYRDMTWRFSTGEEIEVIEEMLPAAKKIAKIKKAELLEFVDESIAETLWERRNAIIKFFEERGYNLK